MKSVQLTILAITGAIIAAIGLLPRLTRLFARPLRVGDWIRLAGGCETEPKWLGGRDYIEGQIVTFIDSANRGRAAVVKLREAPPASAFPSDIAVLYLRYKHAQWKARHEIVHVELWRHSPSLEEIDTASDAVRTRVESHASYRAVS